MGTVFIYDVQVVVVLQQVFPLIQTILGKWLCDSEVVEVSLYSMMTIAHVESMHLHKLGHSLFLFTGGLWRF